MELTAFQSQAVIAFLSALLGGIVSATWIHHLGKKKAEFEYKRLKLEQLFSNASNFTRVLQTYSTIYLIAAGDRDVSEMMRENNERFAGNEYLPNCQMLCNLYFPSLVESFELILKQRDEVNTLGVGLVTKQLKANAERSQKVYAGVTRLNALLVGFMPLILAEFKKLER